VLSNFELDDVCLNVCLSGCRTSFGLKSSGLAASLQNFAAVVGLLARVALQTF
jgi:hypothetical protein